MIIKFIKSMFNKGYNEQHGYFVGYMSMRHKTTNIMHDFILYFDTHGDQMIHAIEQNTDKKIFKRKTIKGIIMSIRRYYNTKAGD